MKRNSSFRLSIAIVFVALFPAPRAAAPAEHLKIKLANGSSPPILDSITPYVAVEAGIFKKLGIDVEMVEFRGDNVLTTAMLSGDIQVCSNIGATSAMVSASKGAKLRLWMVPQPVTPYQLIARKDAAPTIKALAGKTFAVSGIGAVSYHIPRMIMERNGVDPEKVKYVVAGSNADRFRAVIAGKADATVVSTIEAAKLAQYPELVNLATAAKVVPEIPFTFAMAREDFIQKEPDAMYKLARGMIEANRWIAANKSGTVSIAAKIIPDETPEILAKAYDQADPRLWGANGDLSEANYKFTSDFLVKVGNMTDPLPYDKFFDRRFIDRALKELGRK
ncbi:MAG TPA: ABC transporter substrate-binding protein [Candidatus Binatia bacterium]|jgi:NitT/TauT family transport system substrate-binding protein